MKKLKQLDINGKAVNFVLLDLRNPEEMNAYYNLFLDCFGERANVRSDTFKWFNLQFPMYNNLSFAFIDAENSRMMTSYGLQPGDATVNGQIMKYVLCTNVMTHPEYAGQGLFTQIGKESLEFAKDIGIAFAFGVPNEQAVKGHIKVGWEVVNEIKFFENNAKNILKPTLSKNVELNKLLLYNDSVYLKLFVDKFKFYFNRSTKWLGWRLSKPFNEYLDFTISEPGKFAFMVVKKYYDIKSNTKKLHIVDFGYEKIDSLIELIKHCQSMVYEEGYDLINLWQYPFNTIEVQVLKDMGFVESTSANPIIIHKLGNVIGLPESEWHITLFDNDVY